MAERQNLWPVLVGMGTAALISASALLVFTVFDRRPDQRAAVATPEQTSAPEATRVPSGPSATTSMTTASPIPTSTAVPATATPALSAPTTEPEATAVVLLPTPTETAVPVLAEEATAVPTATEVPVGTDEPALTAGVVLGIARNTVLPSGITVLECEGKQVGNLVAHYRGKGVWIVSLNIIPPNGDLSVVVNETTGTANVSSFPNARFPQNNNC